MEEADRDRPPSTRHGDEPTYQGQPLLNPISYPPEYPQESQQRQQSYQSYNPSLYSLPPQPHSSTYTPVPPFAPRQTAAIEVLASQFGGTSQYYVPGESPTTVPPGVSHHQSSSQFSSPPYGQYSPSASRLPPAFSSNIPELNQPGPSEPVDDPEFGQQQQTNSVAFDDAYNQYQTALKRTFQNAREGRLGEAGTSLLTITDWLLSNAVELGKWNISLFFFRIKKSS